MMDLDPITRNDIANWIAILSVFFIALYVIIMIDKKYTKFEEECESNNGVVVMDGRGANLCIRKTMVIQI